MKIGSNKDINKAEVSHKKFPVTLPESGMSHGAAHLINGSDKSIKETILLTNNQK